MGQLLLVLLDVGNYFNLEIKEEGNQQMFALFD